MDTSDPLVVGRAMTMQFNRLFVEPLTNTPAPPILPIIVLDGLDECADHKIQQQILRLFIVAIRDSRLSTRVRILITSRPEPHLREVLEAAETVAICHQLVLSADAAAFNDIERYLLSEFARIRSEYLARGIDLGAGWPSSDILDHLVNKSSGMFIYAATVIRFVDDEYAHPADRLDSVLSLDPQSTAPLDDLYSEILSVVPQALQPLRVLHAIWEGTLGGLRLDPEEMDMLLHLRDGSSRLAFRGLHSLLYVPPRHTRFGTRRGGAPRVVGVLHASLLDYLCDARRSGRWCVSTPGLHADYVHCTILLLSTPRRTESTRSFYRYTSSTVVLGRNESDKPTGKCWRRCLSSSGIRRPPIC
jgi:hypothetical protein